MTKNKTRALDILHYKPVDRLPAVHFGYWQELLQEWAEQGHISRELAERRIFPAIDVYRSGTRKEELLLDAEELACAYAVRRAFAKENATEGLFELMKKTKSNRDLAATVGEWSKTYKAQR